MRARALLSALVAYALLTLCLALEGCSMSCKSRLLAVGGDPCHRGARPLPVGEVRTARCSGDDWTFESVRRSA
jgi:hypothetical protein